MSKDKKDKYFDPLHVPSARLVVSHKGKEVLMLNKDLLDRQNCWENLEHIKAGHRARLELEDKMKATDDQALLKALDRAYTEVEFRLQDFWGFDRNINFHKFWNRPKCQCPRMDNEDAYPTGYYVRTDSCPLHGGFYDEQNDPNRAEGDSDAGDSTESSED